jgi:hypothetical protein
MQTKPEQITARFAPEMQFNVEILAPAPIAEPILQTDSTRFLFIAGNEMPNWRGVRFSALND